MIRAFAALPALVLAACSQGMPDGAAILYDEDYSADILLDNGDGITAPDGLLWHEGKLFIADEGGSAVRVWDGTKVRTLADASAGLISPEDLVFDDAGTLWFTDDSAGGAWRVTTSGAERVDRGQIAESEGIARMPRGGLAIGDGKSGRIFHVTREGGVSVYEKPELALAKPESMALGEDDTLIIADNREDRLLEIAGNGALREIVLPADLSPETIALDGKTLWITDSHNGRIYRMVRGEPPETVALFTGDLANVGGIAIGPKGTVYVSVQADLDSGRGYIVSLAPRRGEGR